MHVSHRSLSYCVVTGTLLALPVRPSRSPHASDLRSFTPCAAHLEDLEPGIIIVILSIIIIIISSSMFIIRSSSGSGSSIGGRSGRDRCFPRARLVDQGPPKSFRSPKDYHCCCYCYVYHYYDYYYHIIAIIIISSPSDETMISIYISISLSLSIYIYIYTICMYVCMYIYIYIYIYIYTHTYMYMTYVYDIYLQSVSRSLGASVQRKPAESREPARTPSPPVRSFPTTSPWVKLSGRPPIKFNGHENSHPLELRVCLSQTLWHPNS